MDIKKLFGLRIKELRVKNKQTQAQLAEIIEIDPKHQSCIETGRNFPSSDLLEKYAKAFKISTWELLTIEHNAPREVLREKLLNLIDNSTDEDFIKIYRIIISILK